MNEVILDKKIKAWEDLLLDLGKRNKMISFRESKRGTLKILKPGFDELYQKIVVEGKELTFQKAIDRDSDVRVYSILSLLDKLSCPMEVTIGDIRGEGSLSEISKTLKNLRSKAHLAMDEQGTNILYLVFGFIEWHEKGNRSDSFNKSPLILVPVSLILPSVNAQYKLKKNDDEIVVNPTLAYLFERNYGIILPEFDAEKDTLESFMEKMEELVNDIGWRIVRECSMGLVSFLKISMYKDLIANEKQIKNNSIIRTFVGERNEVNTFNQENILFDHDNCRAMDTYQVLDADSSQQDAITLSQKGVSFVMQGPPGTGKSQTIANIIAQALADEKKVLFVSEKMAALDVVYRRLQDVRLSDFCLSLHNHKANKKEIIEQLGANLNLPRIKVKDEEVAKLTRLDMVREQLKAYVHDIHQTIMPLEMSLYEVYGAISELEDLPDIEIHLVNIQNFSKDQMNRLANLVMNFDKAQNELGSKWYKNPWQGITTSYLEPSQKRDLQNKLQIAIVVLSGLEECRLKEKMLSDILTIKSIDRFKKLYEQALYCELIPHDWFYRPIDQEEVQIRDLRKKRNTIDALKKELEYKYGQEYFELSGHDLREHLFAVMKDYHAILRNNETEEKSFLLMEEDLHQIQLLEKNYRLLLEPLELLSQEYQMSVPSDFISIDRIITTCKMLFEKRNITDWYFSEKDSVLLLTYVQELNDNLTLFAQQKERLIRRYSSSVLEQCDAQYLLNQVIGSKERILPLIQTKDFKYSILCEIAGFNLAKIQKIEEIFNHNIFEEVTKNYGLPRPNTLEEVKNQIITIEKIRDNKIVSTWESFESRNKSRNLLEEGIIQTNHLIEAKRKLNEFFTKRGITIDLANLSEEEVNIFQHAHEEIPEISTVIVSCNDDDAYNLLDDIEQNIEKQKVLIERINQLRKEYQLNDSLDEMELLSVLREYRDDITLSTPCSAWATAKNDAIIALKEVSDFSKKLKEQYKNFIEIYESSVFEIDYTGMLNRFKVEYTGLFKSFKSNYKEDVKQIRLVCKEIRKKISDSEIIALLQALRQYNEDLTKYQNLSTQISKMFNISEYDIWHDWENVRKRIETFEMVGKICLDDVSTYRFINENCWETILTLLVEYEELNNWFKDNESAKKYYSDLYNGAKTDTLKLRNILAHVKTTLEIFASPDHYLKYVQSEIQQLQQFHQEANEIMNIRSFYAEHINEIKKYTDIEELEKIDMWEETLSQLNIFEEITASIGETEGFSIVSNYYADKKTFEGYYENLMCITKLAEYAQEIRYIVVETSEIDKLNIGHLIKDMYTILNNIDSLLSIYKALSIYYSNVVSLTVDELNDDLRAIIFCQKVQDKLVEIEKDAQVKMGKYYNGLETDWEQVKSNIIFCNKINQLFSGELSEKIIDAFVSGKVICSEAQLAELENHYSNIKSIEVQYPNLKDFKDLHFKRKTIEKLDALLNDGINIKNIIVATMYNEYGYTDIMRDLQQLTELQTTQNSFNEDLKKAKESLPTLSLDQDTDWDSTLEVFSHIKAVKREINTGDFEDEIELFITNGIPGFTAKSYFESIERLMKNTDLLDDITSLFSTKDKLETYSLEKLARRFKNCLDQFDTMDAWIDRRDCKKVCIDNGLEEFITKAEDAYYPIGTLHNVFKKSFYYQWFESAGKDIESVANFRVRTQEGRVETFRELDSHQLPVDQMRIREKLIRGIPNRNNFGRATDEMAILLHEMNKKRRIMPLRKLFKTIPNLLLKLKPCLMMSPLSVSYFLDADIYKFDMVIFDEASQIFPQDAIGAILRGKQVIIAGDSKQLPPTNFFTASTSNDSEFDPEGEEDEEVNFDSILEEASNSLPNRSLLWHYRSRFEDLISFSNHEIYQNNLITFPSSTIHQSDTGVEYVYVENGVYDKRCNYEEAKEIVRLVEKHLKDHPDRSLGIIAFSEIQQSIIEEEINKFRVKHLRYEEFFDERKEEPFFIKNLENVQGDERDTIIFSICYAKNASGRMFMRFGPLGNPGGERRLNVAITRAKYNVKLVGSIRPDDIDLSRTKSEGVRMLRSYIMFAMNGNSALSQVEKKKRLYDVDIFSKQVGEFLISNGYSIQMNVGSSEYTVDIAVKHPKNPDRFIAGIECDGNSYYMARTVRDREHLRTEVLERMGWKMYRVWSTEWIRNPEAEKKRLLSFLRKALQYPEGKNQDQQINDDQKIIMEQIVSSEKEQKISLKEKKSSDFYDFPLYKKGIADNKLIYKETNKLSKIVIMISGIVEAEQPIHRELLYKRVAHGLLWGKVTQKIRDTINRAIETRMQNDIVIEGDFVRFANYNNIQARRSPLGDPDRAIEYISVPEIAAAMLKIIEKAYGIDRNILCAETAKIFGFERTGSNIKQRTHDAIDYLIRMNKISINNDKIQLLEG